MNRAQDIQYHQRRAAEERVRALEAGCAVAAQAHRILAELHEERAAALSQAARPPRRKLAPVFAGPSPEFDLP